MKISTTTKTTPEIRKKPRLPDQIDLIGEDGTVYHVHSFFCGEKRPWEKLWMGFPHARKQLNFRKLCTPYVNIDEAVVDLLTFARFLHTMHLLKNHVEV